MAHALSLGARGLGCVWPWPSVGCVIAQGARVVGRGTSDPDTLRHAERVALDQAGAAARGSTVYVTLEPCAHTGRTPPCADALVAAGVSRVVVATGDPNPLVSGRGIDRLRASGIHVDVGLHEGEAKDQHRGFFLSVTEGRPKVTLKLAMTVDGRIATATGESRWITGSASRRAVHAMRLSHDAVLVGGGTARADNPALTVRNMGEVRQPVRVVASRRLSLPWPNRLAETSETAQIWLVHGTGDAAGKDRKQWTTIGAKLIEAPVEDGQLAPVGLLAALGREGLTRVFCEGGGALGASLLGAGLVDELVVMTAGFVLGAEGQPGVGALGISSLAEARRFRLAEVRSWGVDVMHRWQNEY